MYHVLELLKKFNTFQVFCVVLEIYRCKFKVQLHFSLKFILIVQLKFQK